MSAENLHRMTSGNIAWNLIRFAMPSLCGHLLISLYGAADVFIVSYFADSATLAATATGAQAIFTLMALAIGLMMGGSILIGQYFGAKRENEVAQTISTFFALLVWLGIACSIFMILFAKNITDWMKTPPEAWTGAYHYILICGGGMILLFIYEGISSALRGLGDSKTPLKFISVACVVNVLLDLLFIGVFHWGAGGAASATVLAQMLSAIVAIIYLRRKNFIFDFKIKNFQMIPEKAKMILKLGIPAAIQQTFIFMSFTIMTVAVNKLGVTASAVLGISNRIDGFMILPSLAFGGAVSVMAAQNMGANLIERAKHAFYTGFLLTLLFAVPSFILMYYYPENLMKIANSDPEIITAGGEFMLAYSPDCLLIPLVFCINGFLNGCGRTRFTMCNNVASSAGIRVPFILWAKNLFQIGLSMPVSTVPQLIVAIAYFYSGRWKKPLIKQLKK